MKAILIKKAGSYEQLEFSEYPKPECQANEILVQIKFAGINYIDIYFRKGLYPVSHYPYIPGKEGSGIVVACGESVTDFKIGDRVAFCSSVTGTYAEYAVVSADQAVSIPNSISFETAAAIMLQGLTAYYLSHLTFPIQNKQTVLIHAGAGGVGLLLIQMAKMRGAMVLTTVSNQEKAEVAKKAGADVAIIYTQTSFLNATMSSTHQQGVSVVYDAVGKTTFDDSLKALSIRGMLVSYGQSSGPVPAFELSKLSEKSLYLTRPSLFHYAKTKTELKTLSDAVFSLLDQQKLHITIAKCYALENASKAHYDIENRNTIGKLILKIL